MTAQILELRGQRAAAFDAANELQASMDAEGRDMTAEEKTRFEGHMAAYDQMGERVARLEQLESARVDLDASKRQTTPDKPEAADLSQYSAQHVRVIHPTSKVWEKREDAFAAGQWCLGAIYNRPDSRDWCTRNGLEFRIQSEGVATAGGVLVPDVVEAGIAKLREGYGTFRANAKIRTMSSDHQIFPRETGNVDYYVVAEGATITASQMAWDSVTLTANKVGALTRYSSEVGEDAVVSLADEIADNMAFRFAFAEDEMGWNGEGASADAGIQGVRFKLASTGAGAGGSLTGSINAAAGLDTYAEYTLADLANAMSVLPNFNGANNKWYCSQTGWIGTMLRLLMAQGGATAGEAMAGAGPKMFLGYPVVIVQQFPIITTDVSAVTFDDGVTLSDSVFVFGDLSKAASFGDRKGISIKVDDSRYMELDQIAVRGIERYDINVHDVGTTAVAGPLVALCGE